MAKVMMVTGGSRGIGAATARMAGARGYDVCVNYHRNPAAAEAVVAEIEAAGGRAIAVAGNMAEPDDVDRLFAACDERLGPLSVLVNNAGIITTAARVDEMTADRINALLAVNITGCFLVAKAAIRRMSTRYGGSGGTIVNLSSAAARLGGAGSLVDYAASKGAIDTFTVGLAQEVAAEGIRVNALRPGLIETDIHDDTGLPNRLTELGKTVPMQRTGTAEEVAEAILWLAGPQSSYITGAILDIGGGR